jgi:hypothetical protein
MPSLRSGEFVFGLVCLRAVRARGGEAAAPVALGSSVQALLPEFVGCRGRRRVVASAKNCADLGWNGCKTRRSGWAGKCRRFAFHLVHSTLWFLSRSPSGGLQLLWSPVRWHQELAQRWPRLCCKLGQSRWGLGSYFLRPVGQCPAASEGVVRSRAARTYHVTTRREAQERTCTLYESASWPPSPHTLRVVEETAAHLVSLACERRNACLRRLTALLTSSLCACGRSGEHSKPIESVEGGLCVARPHIDAHDTPNAGRLGPAACPPCRCTHGGHTAGDH